MLVVDLRLLCYSVRTGSMHRSFLLLALVSVAATFYVMRLLPRAFVKMLALSALRAFYRIEKIHPGACRKKGGSS